jgi:hypothetical protein
MIWITGPIVETIIYGVIGGAAAELGRQMVENSSQPQPDQEQVDWGIWLRQRMAERAEEERQSRNARQRQLYAARKKRMLP